MGYPAPMNKIVTIYELLALPVNERLEIASALWESLSATPEAVPVPDWHLEVIKHRLAEDDTDPSPGESWPDLRRRLEGGS